jgi:hypothetical protein
MITLLFNWLTSRDLASCGIGFLVGFLAALSLVWANSIRRAPSDPAKTSVGDKKANKQQTKQLDKALAKQRLDANGKPTEINGKAVPPSANVGDRSGRLLCDPPCTRKTALVEGELHVHLRHLVDPAVQTSVADMPFIRAIFLL